MLSINRCVSMLKARPTYDAPMRKQRQLRETVTQPKGGANALTLVIAVALDPFTAPTVSIEDRWHTSDAFVFSSKGLETVPHVPLSEQH